MGERWVTVDLASTITLHDTAPTRTVNLSVLALSKKRFTMRGYFNYSSTMENYMYKFLPLLAALLLTTSPCWSGESAPAMEKPSLHTSQIATVTAKVEAINQETREVTLRGPEGNTVSFVVSEAAHNLDQVSVGDTVMAEYEQSLSIEVFANDGTEPNAGQLTAAGRAEKGEMPAGAIVNAQVITATVEEINLENNTFKLKGPSGEVKEYVARNPENLKKAAVGDLVVITYTEAVAIRVEKAAE